jgi:hypothetical protein
MDAQQGEAGNRQLYESSNGHTEAAWDAQCLAPLKYNDPERTYS